MKLVLALLALLLFAATGSGAPPTAPTALSAPLGPLAGSPILGLGGGLAFVLGVVLLGRGERYALTEVLLVLAAGGAAAFTAALAIGVARRWEGETLGALAVGALAEALVAVGLTVRVATQTEKKKLLFVPGLLGTAGVTLALLLIVVLGAG